MDPDSLKLENGVVHNDDSESDEEEIKSDPGAAPVGDLEEELSDLEFETFEAESGESSDSDDDGTDEDVVDDDSSEDAVDDEEKQTKPQIPSNKGTARKDSKSQSSPRKDSSPALSKSHSSSQIFTRNELTTDNKISGLHRQDSSPGPSTPTADKQSATQDPAGSSAELPPKRMRKKGMKLKRASISGCDNVHVPALMKELNLKDKGSDTDSSFDERGTRNRIGNVPLKWYEKSDHFGYDIEGNRLLKPKVSALEQLIAKIDDPRSLRTVWDPVEQEGLELTDKDIEVINNILYNKFPSPDFDAYPDTVEYVTFKPGENPFDKPRNKGSFLPSKAERKRVNKYLKKLRKAKKNGTLKKLLRAKKKRDQNRPYLLWDDYVDDTDPLVRKIRARQIPMPRQRLPQHDDSYNPPPEFLPTEEQVKERSLMPLRNLQSLDPLPTKFDNLRSVPAWKNALMARYRRCLDLFEVPRQRTRKIHYKDPDQMLPPLPSPQDLRPYPCKLGFEYKGHRGPVHSLSCSASGQWLATGCDDGVVRVFEVTSGKLMFAYKLPEPIIWVSFNPNMALNVLAALAGNTLYIFVPRPCATTAISEATIIYLRAGAIVKSADPAAEVIKPDDVVDEVEVGAEEVDPNDEMVPVLWKDATPIEAARGLVLKLVHHHKTQHGSFHCKGDYIAVAVPKDHVPRRRVVVHILSKRKSINPFKKYKAGVTAVHFLPNELEKFCLATKKSITLYNLLEGEHIKRLKIPNVDLTCMDIHHAAENRNMLCGTSRNMVYWYDLDLGEVPYKSLKTHRGRIRSVAYHTKPNAYPLFATAADDGQVHVYHGTVFDDYTKNAFIVPLKILKGHKITKFQGVLQIQFHTTLPWLFTCGADGRVLCWVE